MKSALITGAGGFIGAHLTAYLRKQGYWVRGVDLKLPDYAQHAAHEFLQLDLRRADSARIAAEGMDDVYALAADMGGIGYTVAHDAHILHSNALINLNTLEAARQAGVRRYLYSSSACVYPEYRQLDANVMGLRETDAYPAQPDTEYGWEKLFTEHLVDAYRRDHGLDTRIVRFHNIYGSNGTWDGGREKAPAALCRKIAVAKLTGNPVVDIWGDGEQTRSFCYIDDCVEGIYRLMESGFYRPLNLGSETLISINDLAYLIADIAGVPSMDIQLSHVSGAQGVRGRNSDNALLREVLGWQPSTTLRDGLAVTYQWIESQVQERLAVRA